MGKILTSFGDEVGSYVLCQFWVNHIPTLAFSLRHYPTFSVGRITATWLWLGIRTLCLLYVGWQIWWLNYGLICTMKFSFKVSIAYLLVWALVLVNIWGLSWLGIKGFSCISLKDIFKRQIFTVTLATPWPLSL